MSRVLQITLRYLLATILVAALYLGAYKYGLEDLVAHSARTTVEEVWPAANLSYELTEAGFRSLATHRGKALVAEVAPEVEYVRTTSWLTQDQEGQEHFFWTVEFEVPDELEIPQKRHPFFCGIAPGYGTDFHVVTTRTGKIEFTTPYDLVTAKRPPLCAGELLVVQETGDKPRK